MDDLLQVGAIATSHGIHGEAKVFPMTDDVSRFKKIKEIYLDTGVGMRKVHVTGCRFFKQMVILKFEEFRTPEEIDALRRRGLYVERKDAVPLEQDEYFIADLLNLTVQQEDGRILGTLRQVIQTGANDVYVVETVNGGEVLLPAIKDCIREVLPEEKRMVVRLLPGLVDEEE